jgi:hypothetical protein
VGNSFYNNNTQYTELAEQGTLLAEVEALAAEVQADLETVQGYLSHQVIGGAGLTGGGDLTADRTLAVGQGTGITVNADDVALDTANTRNVDHATVTLTAGAGLTGGGDTTTSRTFAVGAGTGITVNADDVALDTANTRNVDHATVSVTAGTGLTGGGTIAATRTVSLDGASTLNTDHALVSISAGTGLSGGGTIAATRTLSLDAASTLNTDHATVSISAGSGLSGGGTIAATRTLSLASVADKSILANISGSSAAPSAQTLSAILDAAIGSTRGMIAVRGASLWGSLAIGSTGRFLKSDGTDPSWAALPGGGDLLSTNNLSDVASASTARANLVAAGPAEHRGYVNGLTISNNGAAALFDLAAGTAVDSTQAAFMTTSGLTAKNVAVAWAVGSSAGALDTGAIAANTGYFIWLIKRPDTGVVDVLASTSASAPTMPTNYTLKRLVGWVRTDGSSNLLGFTQVGNQFLFNSSITGIATINPGTSAVLVTLTVPVGVKVGGIVNVGITNTTATDARGYMSSPDQTDVAPGVTNLNFGCSNAAIQLWNDKIVRTNTSGQIRYRMLTSDATTQIWINTAGFVFHRELY